MKTIRISSIIAGIMAGALTLWFATPVKYLNVKNLTKKVRPLKKEKEENNDHLFI